MPKFKVEMNVFTQAQMTVEVEADDIEDAKKKAIAKIPELDFDWEQPDPYDVDIEAVVPRDGPEKGIS